MNQNLLFKPASDWKLPSLADLPSWADAKRVAVDLETCDPQLTTLGPGVRRDGFICGVAFAIEDGPVFYLPIRHEQGENLPPDKVFAYLRDQAKVFTGPGTSIVGANLQYDLDYLIWERVNFAPEFFRDIQVAEPLLDELQMRYSLDAVAQRHGIPGKDERLLREAAELYGMNPKDELWRLPPEYVGAYAEQDVRLPLKLLRRQEKMIDHEDLWQIYDLESRLLPVLVRMRQRGVRISFDQLERVEEQTLNEEAKHLAEVKRLTGVEIAVGDIWKAAVLAPALEAVGITVPLTPKTGVPSIKQELLDAIDHPVGNHLNMARKVNKIRTTFAASIRRYAIGDRLHGTLNQLRTDRGGARFGRLSCVAEWTEIETAQGRRRIANVEVGDMVLTHRRRYRCVSRTILKGVEKMFDVRLSNGEVLTATSEHRLLLSDGSWRSIQEIRHVGFKKVVGGSGEGGGCCGTVSESGAVDDSRGCGPSQYDGRQCARIYSNIPPARRDPGAASSSVLCVEGWRPESHDGENGGGPSRLCGGVRGRLRVSDSPPQREAGLCAQGCCCGRSGAAGTPAHTQRASHRRRPEEQQPGQPRPLHTGRSPKYPQLAGRFGVCEIEEIIPRGRLQVYDLTVEEDHSYSAAGIFHHNSADPNLQQQPARDPFWGPMWRAVYLPDEGGEWLCNDFAGQEPRWLTHFAELAGCKGGTDAAERYRTNPSTDNHQMMAGICRIPRKQAKIIFLGKCYGMGPGKLCKSLGLSTRDAYNRSGEPIIVAGPEGQRIIDQFDDRVPYVKELAKRCQKRARDRGYIITVLGRRCRFPVGPTGYEWTHNALNRLIQGSSADQIKQAMIDADDRNIELQLQVHDELDMTIYFRPEAEELAEIMRDSVACRVPMKVDTEIGPDWGHIK